MRMSKSSRRLLREALNHRRHEGMVKADEEHGGDTQVMTNISMHDIR